MAAPLGRQHHPRDQQAGGAGRRHHPPGARRGGRAAAALALSPIPTPPPPRQTSESKSVCYIETSNIDGETNLKLKEAVAATGQRFPTPGDLARVKGSIEYEPPNDRIHTFTGKMQLEGAGGFVPVGARNMVLRGCTLRNTKWILGLGEREEESWRRGAQHLTRLPYLPSSSSSLLLLCCSGLHGQGHQGHEEVGRRALQDEPGRAHHD